MPTRTKRRQNKTNSLQAIFSPGGKVEKYNRYRTAYLRLMATHYGLILIFYDLMLFHVCTLTSSEIRVLDDSSVANFRNQIQSFLSLTAM